ncbi:hypothetical protein [Methanosarcina sp. MSH10X1]|uniref:hypothetical protein n=1 Tax=Methanosarcina sp. MSH10X1 TaxID=2507075 RepID=UPI001F0BF424|nr:hypothetical protein [Methanosarcina sp. MSH10X1]
MRMKLIISLLVLCLILPAGLAQAQFGGSGCDPIKFINVTPERFECMKDRLQAEGITVPPGNEGELSGQGFTADFEWDGQSNLTIMITDKPFFVSCENIDQALINFVKECDGT